MMKSVKHTVSSIGEGAIDVVDRIGRKRALIGLAILAAATAGAIAAIKLLRRRSEQTSAEDGTQRSAGRRGKRRAANPNGAGAAAQ
jgi:hypothetical protein